jgi:hypothetical protein
MATIEIKLVGIHIAITLQSKADAWTVTRTITALEALSLSFLFAVNASHLALRFKASSGVDVQIINHPYTDAFLSMPNLDGSDEPVIVAHFEGETVIDIGLCLLDLYHAAQKRPLARPEPMVFRRAILSSYFDNEQDDEEEGKLNNEFDQGE